jgi:hypothetical protein
MARRVFSRPRTVSVVRRKSNGLEECNMLGDRALTSDTTTKLRLPADLLAELQRRGPTPKGDFRVDGWKPSFFRRIFELFAGKPAR